MKLLTFELKKVFFSKKFIYLLLLIIIGIGALFLRNITFQEYIEKEELREKRIPNHHSSRKIENSWESKRKRSGR